MADENQTEMSNTTPEPEKRGNNPLPLTAWATGSAAQTLRRAAQAIDKGDWQTAGILMDVARSLSLVAASKEA